MLAAAAPVCLPLAVDARTVSRFARVDDAGRLVGAGRIVALAWLEVPTHDRICRRTVMPVRCGRRAVLILDDMVRGFVHCDIVAGRRAAGVEGRCTVAGRRLFDERIDLGAELLREGWGFARDDAPWLYRSLERLARTRQVGMWRDAAVDLR